VFDCPNQLSSLFRPIRNGAAALRIASDDRLANRRSARMPFILLGLVGSVERHGGRIVATRSQAADADQSVQSRQEALSLPIALAAQSGKCWQAFLATWRELFRDNFPVADQLPGMH
jgi:hypothetical protein